MPRRFTLRPVFIHLAVPLAAMLAGGAPLAEVVDHTTAARRHAAEAATATDSQSIGEHTARALEHTGAAKTEHAAHPETVKHIDQGEAALDAAEKNAHWFNTGTAADHADDGKAHLDAAGR